MWERNSLFLQHTHAEKARAKRICRIGNPWQSMEQTAPSTKITRRLQKGICCVSKVLLNSPRRCAYTRCFLAHPSLRRITYTYFRALPAFFAVGGEHACTCAQSPHVFHPRTVAAEQDLSVCVGVNKQPYQHGIYFVDSAELLCNL